MKQVNNEMEPWIQLAAAICEHGRQENDTAFLKSDWYEYLKDNVLQWVRSKQRTTTLNLKEQ